MPTLHPIAHATPLILTLPAAQMYKCSSTLNHPTHAMPSPVELPHHCTSSPLCLIPSHIFLMSSHSVSSTFIPSSPLFCLVFPLHSSYLIPSHPPLPASFPSCCLEVAWHPPHVTSFYLIHPHPPHLPYLVSCPPTPLSHPHPHPLAPFHLPLPSQQYWDATPSHLAVLFLLAWHEHDRPAPTLAHCQTDTPAHLLTHSPSHPPL